MHSTIKGPCPLHSILRKCGRSKVKRPPGTVKNVEAEAVFLGAPGVLTF